MEENNLFVIDASYMLAFLLPEKNNSEVEVIFNRYQYGDISLISSPILHFEVGNGLKNATKQLGLSTEKAQHLFQAFLNLEIEIEKVEYDQVFSLATNHRLIFSEASYLYLAKNKKIPLLTLDKNLLRINT